MTIKECSQCGVLYKRNPKYSNQQWLESKFCCRECQYKGKDNSSLVKARASRSDFTAISGKNSLWWKGGKTLDEYIETL